MSDTTMLILWAFGGLCTAVALFLLAIAIETCVRGSGPSRSAHPSGDRTQPARVRSPQNREADVIPLDNQGTHTREDTSMASASRLDKWHLIAMGMRHH